MQQSTDQQFMLELKKKNQQELDWPACNSSDTLVNGGQRPVNILTSYYPVSLSSMNSEYNVVK